ncbi:EVE domain-containing protein [Microbacteriaceae bacterium VKM Ac-2855]|nr:EVE domain-containing protein [Microbacteriaceae bacterium VKM Ac-2855]
MTDERKAWLAVVQRAHVLRGVELGIAQINHGSKAGIGRLRPGDRFVYYSPKTDLEGGEPLKSFTAIGIVAEGESWQAEDGDFRPWRRRIDYDSTAEEAPIAPLQSVLEFTSVPNWGYQLRRGLIEISSSDFALIAHAMVSMLGSDPAAGADTVDG